MRIIHLGPSALPIPHRMGGAIERRMREIGRQQTLLGHKVILYCAGDCNHVQEVAGMEIRTLACRATRTYLRDLEYLRKAIRSLKNEPPDVLHFHALPEGAALARGLDCPKLLSYDYFAFRKGRLNPLFLWYRHALRQFSCLLPVSEFCRRASHEYWKLNGFPLRVLHNGVNPQQFYPDAERGSKKKRALNLSGDPLILYIGRVCEQKGTDVLIEGFARLKAMHSEARLVVAGPAGQFGRTAQTRLTRQIEAIGGMYLGPVAEEELAAIYNLADIFVMPTRRIEMFGMAALEAQACGKPVVASLHGGLPEVISETSGLFFPAGDADALANQLLLLSKNLELRHCLGQAALANAQRFCWQRITAQLDAIYQTAGQPVREERELCRSEI
jgi:glycosyltransferase involved in cell wall biosynthesis